MGWRRKNFNIFGVHEKMKNQYIRGDCLKRGEAWTVCRFTGGLGKRDTPMHTMRCAIHFVPNDLRGATPSLLIKLSVKSTKSPSSFMGSLKDLSFFVLLLYKWYNFFKHSLISFSNPLAIDPSIANSNWWTIHQNGTRCECSPTRHVNKLSLHPIFIDTLFFHMEMSFLRKIVTHAVFFNQTKISTEALSTTALTETSLTSDRLSSWVTVQFLAFINSSLWNDRTYAPFFPSHELLNHPLEYWKCSTLKQLLQHSWRLPLHVYLQIPDNYLYWHIKI